MTPPTSAAWRPGQRSSDARSPEVQLACTALLRTLGYATSEMVSTCARTLRGRVQVGRLVAWCHHQNIVIPVYRGLKAESALAEKLRGHLKGQVKALTP